MGCEVGGATFFIQLDIPEEGVARGDVQKRPLVVTERSLPLCKVTRRLSGANRPSESIREASRTCIHRSPSFFERGVQPSFLSSKYPRKAWHAGRCDIDHKSVNLSSTVSNIKHKSTDFSEN